jgi:hypothetical protein
LAGEFDAYRTIQCPEHIKPNEDRTAYRVSSAAFKVQSDGSFSVDLEEPMIRGGTNIMARYPGVRRAVALTAKTVQELRDIGMSVAHVPIVGENEYHGEVRHGLTRSAAEKAARFLADTARMVLPIDPEEAMAMGAKPLG